MEGVCYLVYKTVLHLSNLQIYCNECRTHVQYTQTDTIRQTDGPLVPMVGLVPIEKDVIPMVLLVNMHLIRGTLIIFPCDLAGNRAIPMVRLVPMEKHPIPTVLLVNMHLIKET